MEDNDGLDCQFRGRYIYQLRFRDNIGTKWMGSYSLNLKGSLKIFDIQQKRDESQ